MFLHTRRWYTMDMGRPRYRISVALEVDAYAGAKESTRAHSPRERRTERRPASPLRCTSVSSPGRLFGTSMRVGVQS